ncbi:unnamed protein product [Dracunculus medinensis]|uniref:Zinc finger protein n=1 Tax=Dracunculus medinensis TaxID=318479 RepID=A0A0N4UJ21_DRAME|nr:unnamed protein product [Dracunculus medinensis]
MLQYAYSGRNYFEPIGFKEICLQSETLQYVINGERQKYQRFREKQYICDHCESTFTMKQNVQTHIINYHLKGKIRCHRKRYKCLRCDKHFKNIEKARKHNQITHERSKVLICAICSKHVSCESLLKEHISIVHFKERPYKCDLCSAKFGRSSTLRRHKMMKHLNFVYYCPFSGCAHPGFKCPKALTAHIHSIHTKTRPYVCEFCSKSFVRRNDLKSHEELHRPIIIACPLCPETFRRKVHLRKHLKVAHHNELDKG